MIKAKMCINCNRLLDLGVLYCPCGFELFVEVILDLVKNEDIGKPLQKKEDFNDS